MLKTMGNFEEIRLLANILGIDVKDVFVRQTKITKKQQNEFEKKKAKLKEGYPLDYLLKSTKIDELNLTLNPNVLIPRPETEEWLKWFEVNFTQKTDTKEIILLDIGTGSGLIGLSLAKYFKTVVLTDFSLKALNVAKENAAANKIENTVFLKSNLLSSKKLKPIFSQTWILLANLPYLPENTRSLAKQNKVNYEPEMALYSGKEGLDLFEILIEQLQIINTEYDNLPIFAGFELDPGNILKAEKTLQKIYLNTEIVKDLNGLPRFLTGKI